MHLLKVFKSHGFVKLSVVLGYNFVLFYLIRP